MADCVYSPALLALVSIVVLVLHLLRLFLVPLITLFPPFSASNHKKTPKNTAQFDKINQLKLLKEERSATSMSDQFAKYSKLDRRIKKLEAELQTDLYGASPPTNDRHALRMIVSLSLNAAQFLVLAIVVFVVKDCSLGILNNNFTDYAIISRPPLWTVIPLWAALNRAIINFITDTCLAE